MREVLGSIGGSLEEQEDLEEGSGAYRRVLEEQEDLEGGSGVYRRVLEEQEDLLLCRVGSLCSQLCLQAAELLRPR